MFGAIELLGHCVGGFETARGVTLHRFESVLTYLADLGPADDRPQLVDLSGRSTFDLRNFIDHGAAAAIGPNALFTQQSIVWLLRRLARALDHYWSPQGDAAERQASFGRAAIRPMAAGVIGEPELFIPFVDHMKLHLGLHGRLGSALQFEHYWRTEPADNGMLLDEDEPPWGW